MCQLHHAQILIDQTHFTDVASSFQVKFIHLSPWKLGVILLVTRTTLSFHRDETSNHVTYPKHKNCNHTANTAESHSEETGGQWYAFNLTYQSDHAVKCLTDCQNRLTNQSSLVVTRRAYCLGSSNKRSSHSELSPDCLQFSNEDGIRLVYRPLPQLYTAPQQAYTQAGLNSGNCCLWCSLRARDFLATIALIDPTLYVLSKKKTWIDSALFPNLTQLSSSKDDRCLEEQ